MRPKNVLTHGAVKPWHVIFIVLVGYTVGAVAAEKLIRGMNADVAFAARGLITSAIASAIIVVYTLVVPEFRRILPTLFQRPRSRVVLGDALSMFAIAGCWGYGLYRAGFCLPALRIRPEWFELLGFSDALSPFQPRHLLLFVSAVAIAPVAEELIFRGFLLNLWTARWGVALGVIASSVFFGAMHFERTVFATGMGIAFALVYIRYDSLWPGIALHGTYNLLAFNWLLGGFFGIKDRATVQDPANWIPEITLAILFFPAAWIFWKRFRPRT